MNREFFILKRQKYQVLLNNTKSFNKCMIKNQIIKSLSLIKLDI